MKYLHSCIFFLMGLNQLFSQPPLNQEISAIIQDNSLHPSVLAVSIHDVSDGRTLASVRSDEFMIPASTLKIITTFTCLDLKGENFQYETILGYSGHIETDGTLIGNIWIIGSGDPSFGSRREGFGPAYEKVMDQAYSAITRKGIKCIDGKICIDASIFDAEGAHPGWSWSDVGNYYGSGIYGVNILENEYRISFNRDMNISELTSIRSIDPPIPGLRIQNEVILENYGTGDNAYIYGGPGIYDKIIKGSIPAGKGTFSIKGSIPNPPLFLAHDLYILLDSKGISAQGFEVKKYDFQEELKTLHSYRSKPLHALIKIANERSINLYCEAFLRTISEDGSRKQGLSAIYRNLSQIGLDTSSLMQTDGSGLSSRNVITADFMTSFLAYYHSKWGERIFNLLPRASHEGTVKGLLRHKSSKGNAWLKSGFIGGVLSYAGLIKNRKGKIYSIAIIANNYRGSTSEIREISEQIIEAAFQY